MQDLDVLYVTRLQRERFPDTASVLQCLVELPDNPRLLHDAEEAPDRPPSSPAGRRDRSRGGLPPYARYFEQSKNGIPVRMAMLVDVMI